MRLEVRLASCPSNINSAHSGAILLDAVKEIWVVSADWKLRALVRAELRERGYEAHGYENLDAAAAELGAGRMPAVLVVDIGEQGAEAIARSLARWAAHAPVVLVTSGTGGELEVPPGVAVLRRPLRVEDVVAVAIAGAGKAA